MFSLLRWALRPWTNSQEPRKVHFSYIHPVPMIKGSSSDRRWWTPLFDLEPHPLLDLLQIDPSQSPDAEGVSSQRSITARPLNSLGLESAALGRKDRQANELGPVLHTRPGCLEFFQKQREIVRHAGKLFEDHGGGAPLIIFFSFLPALLLHHPLDHEHARLDQTLFPVPEPCRR